MQVWCYGQFSQKRVDLLGRWRDLTTGFLFHSRRGCVWCFVALSQAQQRRARRVKARRDRAIAAVSVL